MKEAIELLTAKIEALENDRAALRKALVGVVNEDDPQVLAAMGMAIEMMPKDMPERENTLTAVRTLIAIR